MAMIDSKELVKTLRNMINEVTSKTGMGVYEVTNVKTETYTCDVKDIVFGGLQYTDCPIIGLGLGNLKGMMMLPSQGDLVLVAFMDDTPSPFVLGTVFDTFTQTPDNIPTVAENTFLLAQKTLGARVEILEDNTIIMRATDSTGDADNGGKIAIKSDGSFKLFNKDNFGIEVSAGGAVLIRGSTVNFTQSAGSFP